jgi:hypothetical protein
MSEIRETSTIEDIEITPSEPVVTLGELLAGLGYLAYTGSKLAATGAVKAGALAWRGGKAGVKAISQMHYQRLSVAQITPLVQSAASAREALAQLASLGRVEIPASHAPALKIRLEKLASANDKLGVAAAATDLIRFRQNRLQAAALKLTREACKEIGFTPQTLPDEHGIIVAIGADGIQKLTLAVEKTKDGDVKLYFDADGFYGGACITTLDALQRRLAAKGMRFTIVFSTRKDERPAFDGGRLPAPIQARCR